MSAVEPTDELLGLVLMTRGNAAYGKGDVSRAVELISQAASCHRRDGDTFMLAFCLCAVSIFRTFTGDATSRRRRDGRPSSWRARPAIQDRSVRRSVRSQSGLAPTEPEQSRSYIAESLALNDALGTAVVDENALSMVLMASAVLDDRDAALTQCARALRHGLSLVVAMCACLEATADTLADEVPEVAVVLHGAIDALLPGFVQGELNATLRHRANATIITQLDATSVAELRRRGAAMTEDEATAYALDAIGRAI